MNLLGLGSVKEMFLYMKNKLIITKNNIEKQKTEQVTKLEEPVFIDDKTTSDVTVPDKDEEGKPIFQEKVLYIRWPMRAQMFVDIKHKDYGQIELQRKSGKYNGSTNDGGESVDQEDLDVLSIPDIVHIPVISPVMQNERLMNVDIVSERGIYIGLGQHDASCYIGELDETETPDMSEDLAKSFKDAPMAIADAKKFIKTKEDSEIADIADIQKLFSEDENKSPYQDKALDNPMFSDIKSGIKNKATTN